MTKGSSSPARSAYTPAERPPARHVRHIPGGEVLNDAAADECHGGFHEGGLHLLALAGLLPGHQRDENTVAGEQPPQVVREGQARRSRCLGVDDLAQQAAEALSEGVEARPLTVRPGLPEGRYAAVDEAWIEAA